MIVIWGRATSSNVQKVLWCCSELGLDYQRHDIGREFGGNRTPEYLAMNPNGLVPTLEDEGHVIWESNAILRYLAGRYEARSLYPEGLGGRSNVDRWLDWELGTLAPTIHPVFWGLIRTPPADRDEATIKRATESLTGLWAILDAHLKQRAFVSGDVFSLADIAMGNSVHRWFAFPISRPDFPNVAAWYQRLRERPGFREHVDKPVV